MSIKLALARTTHWLERVIDKIRRGPSCDTPIIDCYGAYTTADHIIVRGRVLAKERSISVSGSQSRWRNFRDFVSLFKTDELSGVVITAPGFDATTTTDEEGFFVLSLTSHADTVSPVVTIRAAGGSEDHFVPVFDATGATFGVISDIDDTVLRTDAFSLVRNLWTSATMNVHQRAVFADAVELLAHFAQDGACFFYVSSSPWNLYDYLQSIFVRTKLPIGPFFLRDLGISETQFITGTHGDHKTQAIETILAANPQLDFTLIGDTGQHDPYIYADVVARYPQRINRVILRRPSGTALPAETKSAIARMQASGLTVLVDFDYRKVMLTPNA